MGKGANDVKRLIFPVVNAVAWAMMLALLGYYLGDVLRWVLIGVLVGLVIGLIAEFGLKPINEWLYRRRVTLVVLLEIPLIVVFVAPYGYVVALSQPASAEICCQTPADFGAEYREVSIPAADGVILAGWFIPPTTENGATVIVLHGAAGNRLGGMWHAEQLARVGFGVLLYDQRALGESTGDRQSWGWLDARDMPYIIDFLAAQPEVDVNRIGAIGLSLGAHILLLTAPAEPRIAAFWLDGVGAGGIEDFPQPQNIGEQFALFMNGQLINMMAFHLGVSAPRPTVELIPQIAPRPFVMVVAPLDDFEYRVNTENYTALMGDNGEQWIIEGAPHTGGPIIIPDEYAARMLAFFMTALAAN
jgi:hypothetical protein